MIVPGSASPLLSTTEATGYTIAKSVRLRSSASAYLSKTPGSAGNRKTWTWSGWIKRGQFVGGIYQGYVDSSNFTAFGFGGSGASTLFMQDYSGSSGYNLVWETTALFRDPSAWYHIIFAYDSTQASSSNALKVYVNGVQQTLGFSSFGGAYVQNRDTYINSTVSQQIGTYSNTVFQDGYFAEVNFIGGQQLTASSFGETDSVTGVWKPKAYTGTYGTNGFYLPFTDVATTSGSNSGLGKDFSGNGNYYNTNNISVTSGSTYDSMTDVPTLTSATAANYAVLNPLTSVGTNGSISDGNLTNTGGSNPAKAWLSTIAVKNGGKFYAEFKLTGGANYAQLAVVDLPSFSMTSGQIKGSGQISMDANSSGTGYYINSSSSTSGSGAWATNDIAMVAFDSTTRNVWFGQNGTWKNSGDPATGANPIGAVANSSELAFVCRAETTTITANFGQQGFSYTPPTGFKALNTYNLPDSTIVAGNDVMDATTYAGNGTSSNTITNAASFKPDFVWVKDRSGNTSHILVDSVRGAANVLVSNVTSAEQNIPSYISSINSNGFSIGTSNVDLNASSNNYVGWQWQAGQGSTSSNTSGSITSTVSVNQAAGFSIVTYTGNGTNGATVGHGLGVAPKFIILKGRAAVTDWPCYHSSIGGNAAILLNRTDAISTSALWFNNTAPTSSVFSLGTISALNGSGATVVAYCWSEIAGFSKFGSYTGNGSTDGVFNYLGFKPKFIMIKRTSGGTGSWAMYDTSRDTYNVSSKEIAANESASEYNRTEAYMDILSNGFKLRNTDNWHNVSGSDYIYAAFAENPLKHSLAR